MPTMNSFIGSAFLAFAFLQSNAWAQGSPKLPSEAKISITQNLVHLEFEWSEAPRFPPGTAVEFQVQIAPKCFSKPVGGRDVAAHRPSVVKTNFRENIDQYVDVWNYWAPAAGDEVVRELMRACNDGNPLTPDVEVAIGQWLEEHSIADQDFANYAVGVRNAADLEARTPYKIDYFTDADVAADCVGIDASLPFRTPEQQRDDGYAWVSMQYFPNTCSIDRPLWWAAWEVTCPHLLGFGACGGKEEYTPWFHRLCAPTTLWPFVPDATSSNLGTQCLDCDNDGRFALQGAQMSGRNVGDENDPCSICTPGACAEGQWCQPLSGLCMPCGTCPPEHQPTCEAECGTPDPCAGLASGTYCGSNDELSGYEGDPADLVTCDREKMASVTRCAHGCIVTPPDENDVCAPEPCTPGDREGCESDKGYSYDSCGVRQEPPILDCASQVKRCRVTNGFAECYCIEADIFMDCQGTKIVWTNSCGVFRSVQSDCATTDQLCEDYGENAVCVKTPTTCTPGSTTERSCTVSGQSGTMTVTCDSTGHWVNGPCVPGCSASAYWSFSSASDTDSSGQQVSGTIDVPLGLEAMQNTAGAVLFRVCKGSGTFANDVWVRIQDQASNLADRTISSLPTAGRECSDWMHLANAATYPQGAILGGVWKVISPASSAGTWPPGVTCSVSGSPTGTCWGGVNITMTRTCKP